MEIRFHFVASRAGCPVCGKRIARSPPRAGRNSPLRNSSAVWRNIATEGTVCGRHLSAWACQRCGFPMCELFGVWCVANHPHRRTRRIAEIGKNRLLPRRRSGTIGAASFVCESPLRALIHPFFDYLISSQSLSTCIVLCQYSELDRVKALGCC